jgi:hypothetical protein
MPKANPQRWQTPPAPIDPQYKLLIAAIIGNREAFLGPDTDRRLAALDAIENVLLTVRMHLEGHGLDPYTIPLDGREHVIH